jgi:hypothetical protein
MWDMYMIVLYREMCKLGLIWDFRAHGITEPLSEFGLWDYDRLFIKLHKQTGINSLKIK